MPVLDTVVLFAAANPLDRHHADASSHLARVGKRVKVAAAGLLEFDLVLKARGYSSSSRMREFKNLIGGFPETEGAPGTLAPRTLYVAAAIEGGFGLDYFDALIAAEALVFDGKLVSSDRDFDGVPGLGRIALASNG